MTQYYDFQERTASMQNNSIKSVQAWKSKKVTNDFPIKDAQENASFNHLLKTSNHEARTAIAPIGDEAIRRDGKEPYEFHDVIDIVNPLHHLPIVNMLYRGITGDEIKPASQIIGGGIYGGPVGAVSGTVNAIAQIQTGKDVAGNVLALAGIDQTDKPALPDDPEVRLNAVASVMEDTEQELPATALAFVNLSETGRHYTKVNMAEGRTAGSMYLKKQNASTYDPYQKYSTIPADINLDAPMPARERMTEVLLSDMPPEREL